MIRLAVVSSLVLAAAASAHSAVQRPSLTTEGAQAVMTAAIEKAMNGAGTGAIAVVDDGGHLLLFMRLDATFPAGAEVSIGKARTAATFRKPTKFFEDAIRAGRTPLLDAPGITPLQGGIPIVIDGQVVGAVGVSGAASADQDEEIAIAGAAAVSSASNEAKADAGSARR